ncbi:MAG: hypothetical protein WDW36_007617 [Sanguina aurantia]
MHGGEKAMSLLSHLSFLALLLGSSASGAYSGTSSASLLIRDVASTSAPDYSYTGKFYMYTDESIDAFNVHLRSCTCTVGSWDHPVIAPCDTVWYQEVPETAQNSVEWFIMELLRAHPARTLHAHEAELFYLPILPVTSYWAQNCSGTSHVQRMEAVTGFLSRSPYFQRFGGADHILTSSFWENYKLLDGFNALMSFRGMLAMFEKPFERNMAKWRCPEKVITVPYVQNSNIKLLPFSEGAWKAKTVDFFFSGSDRQSKPERRNMWALQQNVSSNSVIEIHEGSSFQLKPADYAASITASRFCPSPEGDTPTSRRLYDSIAAGCIPILQGSGVLQNDMWPFLKYVSYEDFAVIVAEDTFKTTAKLVAFGKYLLNDMQENAQKYEDKYRRLVQLARPHLLYGGPDPLSLGAAPVRSMVADNMLRKASDLFRNAPYSCCSQEPLPQCCMQDDVWGWHIGYYPCGSRFPPEVSKHEGLSRVLEQPTALAHWPSVIAVPTHKYMVCEVPLTGASYLRQILDSTFASFAGDTTMSLQLRDPKLQTELPLDKILAFLKDPTWLKAAVVRHPIPRLLAAYFRQRDLTSKSTPEPTEDQYLFLDHAARRDGVALAGDVAAFAAYADDVHARLEGMSRITDLPWDLRYQVSFCGFRAHHVMYDHIARWEQLGGSLPQIFTSLGLWVCQDMQDVTSCTSSSRGPLRDSANLQALLERLSVARVSAQEKVVVSQYYTDAMLTKVASMYSEDMSRFGFTLDYFKS